MFWRNRDAPEAPEPGLEHPLDESSERGTETVTATEPDPKQSTTSWFFWSSTTQTVEGPKEEPLETQTAVSETPQPSRPWYSFFGSDTPAETSEAPNAEETPSQEPQKTSTTSWFWPFSSAAPEPESDTEDAENAEMFRSARTALESSKGNAHYAIIYVRGSETAHLAVCGHETEASPVPFNVKKRPVLPNELIESSLVSARARQKALEEQVAKEAERKAREEDLRAKVAEQKAQDVALKAAETSGDKPKLLEPAAIVENQKSSKTKTPARASSLPASPKLGSPAPENLKKDVSKSNGNAATSLSIRPSDKDTTEALDKSDKKIGATPSKNPSSQTASVLPHMHQNFREITLVTKARLLGERFIKGDQSSERHLYISTPGSIDAKKRKRTKNVVVISMHSLLPPKFVRNYIAQSTGSAKVFGLKAVEAVARWLEETDHQETSKPEISAICLEGQGTITDRVRESFRLLRNWKHEINNADMVFFVSSSMATPAAITLLSAMHQSEEFHLNRKKIGMLSMAGIHCGPYPGLNARVVTRAYYPAENEIIKELFELQKTSSEASKQLSADTKYLCEHNVKMTLVGSLDDQFVPLFSSVDSLVRHPNIFKCIYIDEQCCVPAFIVKLFSVILMMQNVGYPDQNMITDLSERLQGPVNVNNGSHGRIFDNDDVYDMGVRFTMETTSLVHSRALRFEKPGAGVGPARKPRERTYSSINGSKPTGARSPTPETKAQATSLTAGTTGATVVASSNAVAATPRGVPGESSLGEVWQSDKNLYHLPWNVRGVVNDLLTIKHIENVSLLMDLVEEYRRWEPTRAWREMKFCFAAFEEVLLDELML